MPWALPCLCIVIIAGRGGRRADCDTQQHHVWPPQVRPPGDRARLRGVRPDLPHGGGRVCGAVWRRLAHEAQRCSAVVRARSLPSFVTPHLLLSCSPVQFSFELKPLQIPVTLEYFQFFDLFLIDHIFYSFASCVILFCFIVLIHDFCWTFCFVFSPLFIITHHLLCGVCDAPWPHRDLPQDLCPVYRPGEWEQLPSERDLNRFSRYEALNPKRSIVLDDIETGNVTSSARSKWSSEHCQL